MTGNGCQRPRERLDPRFVAKVQEQRDLIAAVPDLHGHFRVAQTAIEVIESLNLQAIFLGDYVDRGESSRETIRVLREAKARHPDWIFLWGNHELMLKQSITAGHAILPQENGAFEEYGGELPLEDAAFFDSLQPYFRSKNLVFIHGGIPDPNTPLENHSIESLTWTQGTSPKYKGPKVVSGHVIVEEPTENHNSIALETGVWSSGVFTIGLISDQTENHWNKLFATIQVFVNRYGKVVGLLPKLGLENR